MPNPMLKWFNWQHLPVHLQGVSAALLKVAEQLDQFVPDGPEKSAGMRKLLEAKDCFVRAAIDARAADPAGKSSEPAPGKQPSAAKRRKAPQPATDIAPPPAPYSGPPPYCPRPSWY